jgi:hypothetical protein
MIRGCPSNVFVTCLCKIIGITVSVKSLAEEVENSLGTCV